MRILLLLCLLPFLGLSTIAHCQAVHYETEPNNTPAEAESIQGATTLAGTISSDDQDAFNWVVSDAEASKSWNFTLQGVPGALTIFQIYKLEYTEDGKGVKKKELLLSLGSRDGSTTVKKEGLIFEQGEYILGLATSASGNKKPGPFRPQLTSLNFNPEDGKNKRAKGSETTNSYRVTIKENNALRISTLSNKSTEIKYAEKLRLGRTYNRYLEQGSGWFSIPLHKDKENFNWSIKVRTPLGRNAVVKLTDKDGSVLQKMTTKEKSQVVFSQLTAKSGTLLIHIQDKDNPLVAQIAAQKSGVRVAGEETEPNNKYQQANLIDKVLEQPISGNFTNKNQTDYFRIEGLTDTDSSVKIIATAPEVGGFQLCLLNSKGKETLCRKGKNLIALDSVRMPAYPLGIKLDRNQKAGEYTIEIEEESELKAGHEYEPNDKLSQAFALGTRLRIKGKFQGDDRDYFKLLVGDKPQLWRIQGIGKGIKEMAYYSAAGKQLARVRPSVKARRAVLDNLYLLPGTHYILISGKSAAYTLLSRPLGTPPEGTEREPNDDTSRMEKLVFDKQRTGLLQSKDDNDYYRFSLPKKTNISLTISPAVDQLLTANLYWNGTGFKRFVKGEKGEPIKLSGHFPAGDYHLKLQARDPSIAEYKVLLKKNSFSDCPDDCEPNDSRTFASKLPLSSTVKGRVNSWDDPDWYRLPVFSEATTITAYSETETTFSLLGPLGRKNLLKKNGERYEGTIPANTQTYLFIRTWNKPDYQITLELPRAKVEQQSSTLNATLDMTLHIDTPKVAAFTEYGQTVTGNLTIKNTGTTPHNLTLHHRFSAADWTFLPRKDEIKIEGGTNTNIPFTVKCPDYIPAGETVELTVEAGTPNRTSVTANHNFTASLDIFPQMPYHFTTVPIELRGSFNVLASSQGGKISSQARSVPKFFKRVAQLNDGISAANTGLEIRGRKASAQPAGTYLDYALPGKADIPLKGASLDLLGVGNPLHYLRDFELMVSKDGKAFTSILKGSLDPHTEPQYFLLEEVTSARFVRLVFLNSWGPEWNGPIGLGELQIFAEQAYDPSHGKGFNIAHPDFGGHVVWSKPALSGLGWDDHILRKSKKPSYKRQRSGQTMSWAIGFHHNRIARITGISWKRFAKPRGVLPDKVFVFASKTSPTGPWKKIGTWNLQAKDNNDPEELVLAEKPWVRFIKFEIPDTEKQRTLEYPDMLQIHEVAHSEKDYQSILTEWGRGEKKSFYEFQKEISEVRNIESNNVNQENAQTLNPGEEIKAKVHLGKTEKWYAYTLPKEHNSITINLSGSPTVDTSLAAMTSSGSPIELSLDSEASSPGLQFYRSRVEGGTTVFLQVTEPPRNVAFLWDSSGSVGPYVPVIYNAMLNFSATLNPEKESVNFLPFGGKFILSNWKALPYVVQTVLNDHPRKESSSAAETTLKRAVEALASRPGSKNIILVTDAATSRDANLWNQLQKVQPRVFSLGLSSAGAFSRNIPKEQDLMQDWAAVQNGHYELVNTVDELEEGFQRAAALIRKPASFGIQVNSAQREPPKPGTLQVTFRKGKGKTKHTHSGALEVILDASGSMLQRLDGTRRIQIAKNVLKELLLSKIPENYPFALRVFGHTKPNSCETELIHPLKPLNRKKAIAALQKVQAKNLAKTPLADSLSKVLTDLKKSTGQKTVVLLTDGKETCDGDPQKVLEMLSEKGVSIKVNIVGFAINDTELEERFQEWAELGNGNYFRALNSAMLQKALKDAVVTRYSVVDKNNGIVARGVVDGEPIELLPGNYSVRIETAPPVVLSGVEVEAEKNTVSKIE